MSTTPAPGVSSSARRRLLRRALFVLLPLVALAGSLLLISGRACGLRKGDAALHAKLAALEREADGLRATVAKLERGEPILPEDAVVLAVSEALITDFLTAQLPFEANADRFRVELTQGEIAFRGSASVTLGGRIWLPDRPDLVGEVRAVGALEGIAIDAQTGTLNARVALDHVDLVRMAGLESLLPDGSLNELARTVRKQLEARLPVIQIPVKIEQAVDLPPVTSGPVRIQGARMPLAVGIADVFAGNGTLWVAVRVVPGELAKLPVEVKTPQGVAQ